MDTPPEVDEGAVTLVPAHKDQNGALSVNTVVQVARDGHHRRGVELGGSGRLAVVLVEPGEVGLGLLLVGKGLDHLAPSSTPRR